jgi:peroxiredoxin
MRRLAVIAIALLLSGCSTGAGSSNQGSGFRFDAATPVGHTIPARDRKAAPALSGTTITGQRLNVSAMRGKVVVLSFWAQWCPPCRVEVPDVQRVYAAYRNRGLTVIGVDVKDNRQFATAFIKNHGITYPDVWDPDSRIALQLRNYPINIPTMIVLDRNGRVAGAYVQPVLRHDLTSIVRSLLVERT